LGVTGILFVVFVAGIYAYASFGGTFVNGLSGELGEVIAARGIAAQKTGQTDEAIAAFQMALQKGFTDPQQRLWTQERLTDELLQANRFPEAVDSAREALRLDGRNAKLHYQLSTALWKAKRLDEALAAAAAWLEAAKAGGAKAQLDPLWYEGTINFEMGQKDKALDAFLQGAHLSSKDRCSFRAAELLHERDRDKEALELLNAYIPDAVGARADAARKLRDALVASAATR
jgi:tetratricopeptide (TPR) repeat protein